VLSAFTLAQGQPEQNSVYELIAQAVCDVALKAEKKMIDIEIDESVEPTQSGGKMTACFDARWTAEAVFNILDNSVKYTQIGGKNVISARACFKNHSRHLHAPFCVIFAPNSSYIARYAPLIWHKSPTNCDAHLAESIFETRPRKTDFFVRIGIRDKPSHRRF